MRGTPRPALLPIAQARFIPAGAGNAVIPRRSGAQIPVHPRGCGEREVYYRRGGRYHGSSPRVRGTPPVATDTADMHRFIPAGAGNANAVAIGSAAPPVHPRGCGERRPWPPIQPICTGSSPRVRGTRTPWPSAQQLHRFIPAGAGNAWSQSRTFLPPAVHPRGCGERPIVGTRYVQIDGSSPRVRGTLSVLQQCPTSERFIPAGAGNAHQATEGGSVSPVHPRGCGERIALFGP